MTFGSVLISLNGLVIRNILYADEWVIIFYRGCSFSISIFIFLFYRYGARIFTQIKKCGAFGVLAGLIFGLSNICFILSMMSTTVANAVFTISLIPFITLLLAFFILSERLLKITLFTIFVALLGAAIMFYGALKLGDILGTILALSAAILFSIFTIILRAKNHIDMLPGLLFSGVVAMLISLPFNMLELKITFHDLFLCILLGGIFSGFVNTCFVFATKHLFAAEATLFLFLEIALSPLWVWIFLSEEIPTWTLIGGSIILTSIIIRALYLKFLDYK